ncbi:MAG: biotin/lipoyl-binding protein [Bacteroidetes bacterium]|nr:biotin/lipoyl-binding protein [Bacteroidota bacterium]
MLQTTINEQRTISVSPSGNQWLLNESEVSFDMQPLPNGLISILYNENSFTALVEKIDRKTKTLWLNINGQTYSVTIKEEIDQLLSKMGLDLKSMQKTEPVKAPMPGMILKVLVEPGQFIKKGDALIILEAMKMENILKSTSDATVKTVRITEKTAVEKGAILIELE